MQPPLKELFSTILLWRIFTFHLFPLTTLYLFYSPKWQLLLHFHKRQKHLCSKIDNKTQANFREYQKENEWPCQKKLEYFDDLFPSELWQYTRSHLNTKYIFYVCSTALSCYHYLKCSFIVCPCSRVTFPSFLAFITDLKQYGLFTSRYIISNRINFM